MTTIAVLGASATGLAVGLTFHWSTGLLVAPLIFGLACGLAWGCSGLAWGPPFGARVLMKNK